MSPRITKRELVAVAIALDELTAYIEITGDEGSLDDEEMPSGKLRWTQKTLTALLARNGVAV